MKRLSILMVAAVIVTVSALLFSCDSEEKKTYEVTVTWEIGGIPSCESSPLPADFGGEPLNFDEIAVTVYDDEKDIAKGKAPIMEGLKTDCSDMEYTIEDIDRGSYFVVIEAIATHDGETLPYFKGRTEIDVPNDEPTAVSLSKNTGSINVGWSFENLRMCGSNDVEEVKIILKSEGDTMESDPIPCDDGDYTFEGLDWDFYELQVEGMDSGGDVIFKGTYMAEPSEDTGEGPDAGDEDDAGTDEENLLEIRWGSSLEVLVVLAEV